MDDLICEQCGTKQAVNAETIAAGELDGWVKLPAPWASVIDWLTMCGECASPERQRESLDELIASR